MQSQQFCQSLGTKADKIWTYDQYYVGNKDKSDRKNGQGEIHWTGAKSIEWYSGHVARDLMHGDGEYRWRHGAGAHRTYEGRFYCNRMHGYGTMSYPDGRVFTGLFHSNMRWGPGVESHACLKADVGLWRGTQLTRLAWRPETPSIAPDLYVSPAGRACVDPHRALLVTSSRKIGETNSALDLLKQYGTDPVIAAEKWDRLYPKNCTDTGSPLCNVEFFEYDYYKEKISMLQEVTRLPEYKEDVSQDSNESPRNRIYYAWNNNHVMIHIMKHSFTHENQRDESEINLTEVLCGPRKQFRPAGKHELDCRTLLMACYLGHTTNVAQLVNDDNVHPDISDSLGNSAVMYATCGDRAELIHFLVEAGANVDSFNDSCCTPLAVALVRFICAQKDISLSNALKALLPPPVIPAPSPVEQKVFEWNISREQSVIVGGAGGTLHRTQSKLSKAVMASKKVKSSQSLKDMPAGRKKTEITPPKLTVITEYTSEESFSEEKRLYNNINTEFSIRVTDTYYQPSGVVIPYLFEVNDMVKETHFNEDDLQKTSEKNPKKNVSKVFKDTTKPSKEIMWQGTERDEFSSMDSIEKLKADTLATILLTILQLLADGADPNLARCPQPALFMAVVSGCSDLVKHLVDHGADINEVYKEQFGYTPLDLAVSRPFTYENLEMIRVILECGATTFHRLQYNEEISTADSVPSEPCGPNLLHAVLARKTESDIEEEIRRNILELLLNYCCNPFVQFKGRSPIDVAMTKSLDLFDIFIKCPSIDLNAIINDSGQTVLVKMFSLPFFKTVASSERLQTVWFLTYSLLDKNLTNLLLFGADPLVECINGSETFANIFVFAKQNLGEMESSQTKPVSPPNLVKESKKTPEKPKKDTISTKSLGKLDDVGDYRQAVALVTECARLLHVRWLQAKLLKELVQVIDKYKHRQWNVIIREHKRKKSTGLWLTTQRCLEIWDILKQTRRKVYNDHRVLKHLLHIVQYYNRLDKIVPSVHPTAEEKSSIEFNINYLLKERLTAMKLTDSVDMTWKKLYVKPELTSKTDEEKFNVCFECALPFVEERIMCMSCKLISFCSWDCMKSNIERANCHPCSDYLKNKYFPSPPESEEILQ